jgi:hypothetical protein
MDHPSTASFFLGPIQSHQHQNGKKTRNQQTETTFKKTKLQTPRGRDGTETWGILGSAFVDVFLCFGGIGWGLRGETL